MRSSLWSPIAYDCISETEFQGHSKLHRGLGTNLSYMRLSQKTKLNQINKKTTNKEPPSVP